MRNEPPDPFALSERRESNGIDALIDDAARQLVAGEPSSSLRSSVRDRIGKRRSAWWAFAPALAAAAMVIIAIVGRAIVGVPTGPEYARVGTPDVANLSLEGPSPAVDVTPTQLVRSERRQLGRGRAAVPPPADEDPIVPPITIEPLRTPPLTEVQIAADASSGVMPIDVEPLQIEPLLGQ